MSAHFENGNGGQQDIADVPESMLDELQEKIGYRFSSPALLKKAMRHRSAAASYIDSNERLEFLGDGILSFAVAEYLFRVYPECGEGLLTQFRSNLVSAKGLAKVALEIGIDKCLVTCDSLNRRLSRRLLSSGVEALIAAVYFDGGIDSAIEVIGRVIASQPVGSPKQTAEPDNYKSLLQQLVQSMGQELPVYSVISECGPDHHKYYVIETLYAGMRFKCGVGMSKKEAEQDAAKNAYNELRKLAEEKP